MSIKLRELIRNVRGCKTAAEERAVISQESALIRTQIREEGDNGFRHRNVAKLLYIHMLGYPTHFGQVESLKLIASDRFPEKRIGYLGLMLLLDERQEVLMLVTNSLKNDFYNKNPYVVGLALCSLGNIASADMARDLAGEVRKLFKNGNPYIRKKAALTAVRIVRKVPDLAEDFVQPSISLLSDKDHGVLLTTITLIIEMTEENRKMTRQFRKLKLVKILVTILKNIALAGYVSEYDVSGISDPFLQCRIIHLLRILGRGNAEASEEMNDVLAQVAINTEPSKNPGNAILYECVQTIMSIEAEGGLRVLAVNILGRFLLNRDNNIRYVALNTLCKVAQSDSTAIQRHRNTVVDCLKEADISIRRRALDLIYALVTKSNVKSLTKELLNYLLLASGDKTFKSDLTDKICIVAEKYAPSKKWEIDTLIQVLNIAGRFVREEIGFGLIALISRTKSLHSYAAHSLYDSVQSAKKYEPALVRVAVWVIGEYGNHLVSQDSTQDANSHTEDSPFKTKTESDVLSLLETLLRHRESGDVTQAYTLNAFVKLAERFSSSSDRITSLLKGFRSNISLELQQRSVEYAQLMIDNGGIRPKLLKPMPQIERKKKSTKKEQKNQAEFSESSEEDTEEESGDDDSGEESSSSEEEEEERSKKHSKSKHKTSTPSTTQQVSSGGDGGLDILAGIDFSAGGNSSVKHAADNAPAGGFDILAGLFDAPSSSSSSTAPTSVPQNNGSVDPLAALMGGAPSNPQQPPPNNNMMPDIFGMGPSTPSPAPSATPSSSSSSGKIESLTAFDKNGLLIRFNFKKPSPERTQIMAVFTNSTGTPFTSFDFKVAVPKFIKLRLKPANGTTIPANNSGRVTQLFECENTMHGTKGLAVRCKIDYQVNGAPVSEQTQISAFPAGV